MFIPFFLELKAAKVPVTLREFLSLIEGMEAGIATFDVEAFYFLARTALVKDERHIDRFDRVFQHCFSGLEAVNPMEMGEEAVIPEDWLRKLAEKHLTEEEKRLIESLGGFDKLMETMRQRLMALKRLRRWVRQGAADELDLSGTIRATAEHGYLDVVTRPERRNAVKLLMFFDIGGSMDDHIRIVEELFSAARGEFRHMEHFYFHNCVYEGLWKDNRRRRVDITRTTEVLRTYGGDYRAIFVGDASMSPYEISHPGGSVEHWNDEAGALWLSRMTAHFPRSIWINPVPEQHWGYTQSIGMVKSLFEGRMFPLTLAGLQDATKQLSR